MQLPPLNALRVFESAARKGSFVAAGEELSVTSAAVSLQVRNLEKWLGYDLFFRHNNQIRLTDAGEDLYRNAAKSLSDIAAFTHSVRQGAASKTFTISAVPSLAERWLPHIVSALPTDVPVSILALTDPVDLERSNIDIHISYGAKNYPDHIQTKLFRDCVVPMAAPQCADRFADLTTAPLIEIDWGRSFTRAPKWANWMAAQNLPPRTTPPAFHVSGNSLGLSLAEQGLGVVLAQQSLAESTTLVPLSDHTMPLQDSYFAISAHHNSSSKRIKSALRALQSAAPAD